jgi:hypothetical protein
VLPVLPSTPSYAHLTSVGFVALQGASIDSGSGATGGFSRSEQSRTNECVVRIQPSTGALNGISVSAAQGSQKPVFAPMGALASGVPPRSRPV